MKHFLLAFTTVVVVFLCSIQPALASKYDQQGCPIRKTPFNYKEALNIALDSRQRLAYPTESVDDLFWKARRFVYIDDRYGDNWQSPYATELREGGDCEDKALWLFTELKTQGYDNLRLYLGKYRPTDNEYHLWIAYTDEAGERYLLDPTIQNRPWKMDQLFANFYKPVYSYDGKLSYRHTSMNTRLAKGCDAVNPRANRKQVALTKDLGRVVEKYKKDVLVRETLQPDSDLLMYRTMLADIYDKEGDKLKEHRESKKLAEHKQNQESLKKLLASLNQTNS